MKLEDIAELSQPCDCNADKAIELLKTALLAINRTYEAGYWAIICAGGSCDTPEYMYNGDPTVREIKQYLESVK